MKDTPEETDGAAASGSRADPYTPGAGPRPAGTGDITVLGIGNTLMADDGVGVWVVEHLDPEELGEGVEVISGATAGMALISHFLKPGLVIVIDAIACEAEPGAIFRFQPDEAGIMNLRSNNIHGMGLPHLITSARLKGADPQVLVFAVQVENVMPRDCQLSPSVAQAALRVRELITEEIRQLRDVGSRKP